MDYLSETESKSILKNFQDWIKSQQQFPQKIG